MMKEQMFEGKTPEEREIILRDTCDKMESFKYEKSFSDKDIEAFQERLSGVMIQISKIEAELARVKKDFTVKMKPLRIEIKKLIDNIQFRSQVVEEMVYIFLDHSKNQVGYYNSEGQLVHTRMLRIEEHQRSIMGASRMHHEEFIEEEVEEES